MTTRIEKLEKLQDKAVSTWVRHEKKGTVEIATGLGKTFIFLKALYTMPKDDKLHLYLYETNSRRKDLLDAIELFNKIYKKDVLRDYNLNAYCYQTVRKWTAEEFGLVGADEIHDALTPSNVLFFSNNKYDAIIGLSAKINISTKYLVANGVMDVAVTKGDYISFVAPIIFKYSLSRARQDGLSRPLNIHIIRHDLDSTKNNIKAGSVKKQFLTTEEKQYQYLSEKIESFNTIKDTNTRLMLKKVYGSKRSKLLYELPSKVIAVKKLLKNVKRTIIFANSINFLESVTGWVVSSRKSKVQNEYLIRQFEKGTTDVIGSFKKLKQGANLKGLDNAIIASYYSKEGDIIQRFGRLRVNEDKDGDVFIFVTKDTIEESWYKNMLENIIDSYKVIRHRDVDQCIKYLRYKNQNE